MSCANNSVKVCKNPRIFTTSLELVSLTLVITKNLNYSADIKNSPFFIFEIQWTGTPTAESFTITLEWDIKGTCFDKIPVYKLQFLEKVSGSSNNGSSILSDDRNVKASNHHDDNIVQLILNYYYPGALSFPQRSATAAVPAAIVVTNN